MVAGCSPDAARYGSQPSLRSRFAIAAICGPRWALSERLERAETAC